MNVPPPHRRPGFWRDLSATHIGNGAVAFLFAATGPVAVVLATGTKGGLSEADLASWVFGAFFINGIISIVYCLAYRQPLAFFWTIPGTVLVGPALTHLSFPEVIGAFLATGLLMIALGLTGWVRRAMQAIPMPIVMGMVAGVFLSFGLDWVRAFETGFWIAAPMTAVYLLVEHLAGPGFAHSTPDRGARGRRIRHLAARAPSLPASIRQPCSPHRRSVLPRSPGRPCSSWWCRWRSPCWWCRTGRAWRC